MRRAARTVFRAALAAVVACSITACRGGSQADSDAVRAGVEAEVAAINARDLDALGRVWSRGDDVLLYDLAPPGHFHGWPAIEHTYKDFFARVGDPKLAVEGLEVRVGGDLATATYGWSMSGTLDGRALQDAGHATEVYRREKIGWRLMHAHVSTAPRPVASPAAANPPAAAIPPAAANPPAAASPAASSPAAAAPTAAPPAADAKPPAGG